MSSTSHIELDSSYYAQEGQYRLPTVEQPAIGHLENRYGTVDYPTIAIELLRFGSNPVALYI